MTIKWLSIPLGILLVAVGGFFLWRHFQTIRPISNSTQTNSMSTNQQAVQNSVTPAEQDGAIRAFVELKAIATARDSEQLFAYQRKYYSAESAQQFETVVKSQTPEAQKQILDNFFVMYANFTPDLLRDETRTKWTKDAEGHIVAVVTFDNQKSFTFFFTHGVNGYYVISLKQN